MRFLSTKLHGIFDYVGGVVLILAPMIFRFEHVGGPAVMIPRIMGVVLIAYSLLTQYEWGLLKVLPMPYHLVIDFAASLFLAISPWLFGFRHDMLNAWLPHVVLGVAVIGLVLVSKTEPAKQATPVKAFRYNTSDTF